MTSYDKRRNKAYESKTIYELLQAILPKGVLDWKDVICTPIAGGVSLGLFLLILKAIPDSLPRTGEANA